MGTGGNSYDFVTIRLIFNFTGQNEFAKHINGWSMQNNCNVDTLSAEYYKQVHKKRWNIYVNNVCTVLQDNFIFIIGKNCS